MSDDKIAGLTRVQPPARPWRPIETAPRDGDVLIYVAETNEQFVAFSGVCPDDGDRQWVFAQTHDHAHIIKSPTHWMPLPPAPEARDA